MEATTATKSTAMEAASAKAASVSTAAATSVTATTSATTSECRSWLSQADRCQCEQGYNRFPHHASSLGTMSLPRIEQFRSGIIRQSKERSR
jgi:hypothetical protein